MRNKICKKISIIIPMYNEESTINELIKRVKAVDFGKNEKEIILVDDGSKDRSCEIAKKIRGIRLLKHEKNQGKGAAIRTGLKSATGEIIAIQDADLELNPSNLSYLVEHVLKNKSPVVYGTRFPKRKHNPENSFLFYNGGRLVSIITNLLYGSNLTDVPCGYKIFRKDVLDDIDLKCTGFEFCPEVTAKILKKGVKIDEISVDYTPRSMEEGKKLRYKDGLIAIWTLLSNRLF